MSLIYPSPCVFKRIYSGDTVLWEKLIVSGHSQGAGMAGMLAKTRRLDRCVMFADMDFWVAGGRPYNWMSAVSQTPADRWFLLAHERDQYLDFTNVQTCATALDVDRYGAFVRVETSASTTFSGRHFLSTDLDPAPHRARQLPRLSHCRCGHPAASRRRDARPQARLELPAAPREAARGH
jgi:hypothetical protein